jgi:hypothetical protein
MAASRIVPPAINLILAHPDQAMEALGAVLAVGAGVTLAEIVRKHLKLRDLTADEQNEIDLLDEASKDRGFWYRTAYSLRAGVIASKFSKGAITPRLRWHRGLWTIDHDVTPVTDGFDGPARFFDRTTVGTPQDEQGQLV